MAAKRLYVDCDDTLLLYKEGFLHPAGFYDPSTYDLNKNLIEYVLKYNKAHPGRVVIWSTRGDEYARAVATTLFPKIKVVTMGKTTENMKLVRPTDIVYDNDAALNLMAPILDPITGKPKSAEPIKKEPVKKEEDDKDDNKGLPAKDSPKG